MSSDVREVLAVVFVLAVAVAFVFAGAFVVAVPFPLLVFLPTAKSPSFRPKVLAHFASSEAEKSASPHKSSPAGRRLCRFPNQPKNLNAV